MSKRAAEIDISDFNCKILRNVFQLTNPPSPESVIEIYLNNTLAYTTDIDMISNYPSSVMYKSLHAEMSESVTRKVVIHDEEDLYTVNSIKLLFTALTYGAIAIKESPLGAYDTLVFPFLAHYLCIDHDCEVFTACVEQYPEVKCSDQDIAEIISKLTSAANKYIECFAADTAEHMFFADVKNKLLQILARHASHSAENRQYNWHELNPDDLCTVLQHIQTVKFCTFTREANDNWTCTVENDSATVHWEIEARDDDKILLKWTNDTLHVSSIYSSCMELPLSFKFYCTESMRLNVTNVTDFVTVWRHAWHMRYEVIMTYLLDRFNDKLPKNCKIEKHSGIILDACLCGLFILRNEDIRTRQSMQLLRDMLIETAAMIINNSDVGILPSTPVFCCLCGLDVVDIFSCKSFKPFTKPTLAVSQELNMLRFVIAWMNSAPYNINGPATISILDAIAIVKLVILSLDFSNVVATELEKNEAVACLTTVCGGEYIKKEIQKIVEALSTCRTTQQQQFIL